MMVKAGGTAVLHQLSHTGKTGQADHILVQILPNLIQSFQPVEQLHILHLRQVAGEHLIEMVVGIDQAGIAQHMAGVESLIGGNIQRRTDGFDEAVLTVQIDVGQQTVVIITGDQLGNMFDQKGRHTVFSFHM